MGDIESPTAMIRRGKKDRKIEGKKPQGKNIMSTSAMQGGQKTNAVVASSPGVHL